MAHIQASGISLAYADRDVLLDVTVSLSSGDRCALAGANGSGKSSLMKIIAGLLVADSGTVSVTSGARVAYLPQSGVTHRGKTLELELDSSFGDIPGLIEAREQLAHRIAELEEGDPELEELVHEHHDAEERILATGYYERDAEIGRILSGLGFADSDRQRNTDEFSGGWQMRIALAKVLLERPDFLLLDEPTNYLDLEARVWLGKFLSGFSGGVLLVSHDRTFLDETVNAIWELFLGGLRRYKGTYSDYERQRKVELEQRIKAWSRQQEEIQRTEDFIRRFRATATKAKQVQSRVKQLEKLDRIEIPEYLKAMHFKLPATPRSGREMITCVALGRSYGDNRVFRDLDLTILRGEKIALVGPNGAGKSTLQRILADRDPDYEGSKTYGTGVALGYYAENDNWFTTAGGSASVNATSVLDAVSAAAHGQTEQQLRNLLGGFLFHGDDVYKSMGVLSGGERSRIALLELLLKPLNLLVLDEPTNHLDMTSKQVLLDALESYEGTIVFVSHDRSFMESLATRVIELKPGEGGPEVPSTVTDFPGDYHYYAWKTSRELSASGRSKKSPGTPGESTESNGGQSSEQEAHKTRRNRIQKLERVMEELLEKTDALQSRHDEVQKELADPLIYGVGASVRRLTTELKSIDEEMAALSAQWDSAEAEHTTLLSE